MPLVKPDRLQEFATKILVAAGLTQEDAQAAAECMVFANLRGVDSHGVLRLIQYVDSIHGDQINPRPQVKVVDRRGATAMVDADGGYGFRPTFLAVDEAIPLARQYGIGVVGVRNSHHFGMAAAFVKRVAESGMIGILKTNALPNMAAPGGAQAVVGNNPIAYGIPRRKPANPILLDMALSQVAFGKIRLAAAEGRPIPEGWGLDRQGRPTTDAAEALAAELLVPVGQHKGFGLAFVSEILAGVMTASPFGVNSHAHKYKTGGVGHLLIVINPAFFIDPETFLDGVEEMARQVKESKKAVGVERLFLPGEIEDETAETRRREGVPVSDELAAKLKALAERLQVPAPDWA